MPDATAPWSWLRQWLGTHGYLLVAAGALLVLTRTVEFTPPPVVRRAPPDVTGLAVALPPQDFSEGLQSPQVVQLRASLRHYSAADGPVSAQTRDPDERGEVLSQPVVTTPLGTAATIEQTVRLERGALQLDLMIHATPRLAPAVGQAQANTLLEHIVTVHSRRDGWRGMTRRVHLDTGGTLEDVEAQGHRIVFSVDDHVFRLDLELHRPSGEV